MPERRWRVYGQMSFADDSAEYKEFVDKFKPKKTTDDCYTPPLVYEAVADWVAVEYGIDKAAFVRPFYPGGDYEREEYPDGCAVVDNPLFSILTSICRHYMTRGVPFFLFAPGLTCLSRIDGVCAVAASCDITYENGANVRTSFVTNMEPDTIARSAPTLTRAVESANDEVQKATKKKVAKYEFPYDVLTAARLGWMSIHGEEFKVRRGDAVFITTLDMMKASGKSGIFGGGLLLSARAAAERAAAERWQLSERERSIQKMLGKTP